MSKPEMGADIPEDGSAPNLIDEFVHRQTFSAFERILCSHLLESISGDPMDSVVHVCRAALSLSPKTADELQIDTERVNAIYVTTEIIRNASKTVTSLGTEKFNIHFYSLDFERHIEPWALRLIKIGSTYEQYLKGAGPKTQNE